VVLSGTAPGIGTTVALSEHSARLLRGAGFRDVRVVPPSLPLHRWPVTERPSGEPVVLFAGHHDVGGGAETAIEAFAACAARDSARLVLAMRIRPGQDEAGLAQGLRDHAHRLGVERIEIRGHVTDMAALIRAASVVVLPAATLAGKADVPVVLLEAMATGRPVVTSDLPSMGALAPAVTTVRPDAAETARAIDALLADGDLWRRHASRGRLLVERDFGEATVARRYADIYAELLSGRAQRPAMRGSAHA
jgi:glycosyltransferase involved in cell wall biosynthesis